MQTSPASGVWLRCQIGSRLPSGPPELSPGPVASAPAVTSDGASTAIRQPFESRSRTADRRDAARARWPYRGDVERGDFSAPCRHADLPSKGLSEGSQVERQDFPDAIKEGCGEVPGVLNLMGERMRAEP